LAGVFLRQMRLRQVTAGNVKTAMETALRDAVWRGERLSLRPLGLEDKVFKTLSPILERLGMDEWLVGMPKNWYVEPLLRIPPKGIIKQAQAIYLELREKEANNSCVRC
jgi:hypothetical protein